MTAYTGMNKNSGAAITDVAHIEQSIADIITTPTGSRIQRRNYGSLVFYLLDDPNNPVTQLKLMSAVYSAVTKWENRVRLTSVIIQLNQGQASMKLEGRLVSGEFISTSTLLTGGQ